MKLIPKIASLALALIFIAAALFSCATQNGAIVMKLGGFDVRYDMYRYAVLSEKESMKILYGDGIFDGKGTDERKKELSDRTLEYLRNVYAVPALAADYGIKADDKVIKALVERRRESDVNAYGSEDALKEEMKKNNVTDEVYNLMTSFTVMEEELFSAMKREGDIDTDPSHVREYLLGDDCVCVLEVLISFEKHGEDEARRLAGEVREKALAGEDFYELVMEYGENIDMFNNPDGYYIMRGLRNRDLEDAAFSLSEGEVSGVIASPRGFSVLMRREKNEEFIDRHFKTLSEDCCRSVFALAKNKKAAELTLETTKTYGKLDVWKIK